jgi:hypothetical protein
MQSILQKKSLILSIIFFILSCFVFSYLYKYIQNNKEQSSKSEAKWQEEDTRRQNSRALVDSVNAISTEKDLLNTHFIQSSDVVPFLDTVEELAKYSKIKEEIVSVEVAKDTPSLLLEINADGNFEAIYKFILLLENSQYDIKFISSNIQRVTVGKSTAPEWTADFKIRLLSFVNNSL